MHHGSSIRHNGGNRKLDDDAAIARMRRILADGRWPSGLLVEPAERPIVEWNLALAIEDRAARRAARS